MKLRELQTEQVEWVKHNFGERESWQPLLGLMEELGEITHAYLKLHQGIRVSEDHLESMRDGVGDVVIFLADFATAMGFDLEDCVTETWAKVKRRDWRKNSVSGGED